MASPVCEALLGIRWYQILSGSGIVPFLLLFLFASTHHWLGPCYAVWGSAHSRGRDPAAPTATCSVNLIPSSYSKIYVTKTVQPFKQHANRIEPGFPPLCWAWGAQAHQQIARMGIAVDMASTEDLMPKSLGPNWHWQHPCRGQGIIRPERGH